MGASQVKTLQGCAPAPDLASNIRSSSNITGEGAYKAAAAAAAAACCAQTDLTSCLPTATSAGMDAWQLAQAGCSFIASLGLKDGGPGLPRLGLRA